MEERKLGMQLVVLPESTSAKEALRKVYQGRLVLSPQQMRAAIESLPYETPKLSATAHVNFDYAGQLDKAIARCIERSQQPAMLNGPSEQLPASELKKTMASLRRW